MVKKITRYFLFGILSLLSYGVIADGESQETVEINLVLPQIEADPYHNPFVAIWIETEKRKGIETIAVWYNDSEWLRDLRQWWRKLGRGKEVEGIRSYDAVTSATRHYGSHHVVWVNKKQLKGDFFLNIEAAREEGGRDFIHQRIRLGDGATKKYQSIGDGELGAVTVTVHAN